MAKELRHPPVASGRLTETEYEATDEHIADGGAADELLVVQADETLVSAPVNTAIASHIADLDAHTKNWFEVILAGHYRTLNRAPTDTIGLVVDTLYAAPMILARAMTLDRIAIRVTTLDAGQIARLGIYRDNGAFAPGELILDAGTVSVAANGDKAITINESLPKEVYWLVVVSDGTPTVARSSGDNLLSMQLFGLDGGLASNINGGYTVAFAFGALPANFPGGAALSAAFASIVAWRPGSLD